jgi:hypothetical protein
MADQMIQYVWADGESLTATVELDDSFPDAVAEAEASVKRLFAYGMGVVRAYDLAAETPLPPTEQ